MDQNRVSFASDAARCAKQRAAAALLLPSIAIGLISDAMTLEIPKRDQTTPNSVSRRHET